MKRRVNAAAISGPMTQRVVLKRACTVDCVFRFSRAQRLYPSS